MFLIDTHSKKAISLMKKSFSEPNLSERYDLQEWIADNPSILGERLLIIQKEFDGFSDTKERLDLLALDENGKIVVIENKLDDSGKDVVWQALKYVSYCATLTKGEICDIYQTYLGEGALAREKLCEFFNESDFDSIRLNPVDSDQRIILAAANFRKEVTSTVLWLRDHGVDITCVKLTPYMNEDKLYLDTEQILPIQDIGDYQIKLRVKKQEDIVSSNEEASRHKLRKRFWEKAIPVLRKRTGIFDNVSPSKDNWLTGASGHSGISYNPVIRMDGARAELYIDTSNKEKNKDIFHKLYEHKDEFNAKLGPNVEWLELPDKQASRVCINYYGSGLSDEEHWDDVIDFLSKSIKKLQDILKPSLESVLKN